MASPIPKTTAFLTVEEYRKLVNQNFQKEISEGQLYDSRDLQRFNENDPYTLMFVQHGQFGTALDEGRALRVFNGAMSWRKRHNVFDISSSEIPAEYINRHAIFFRNHDKYNSPLLHFVVRLMDKGKDDKEAIKRLITYTLEQHIREHPGQKVVILFDMSETVHFVVRLMDKGKDDKEAIKRLITYTLEQHIREHPGQKVVILFDMSETGIGHMDYELVKFIIGSAQNFYPGLLSYMLIYKMPWLLSAAWRIIKGWLSTEAEQFVKFVDEKSITEYVSPDQLSPAMGGTAATN
ncbi:unnamed protein product [Adineta steineri]|uniref:CRAL-TRIO domain-containing protein n=1 Tax=Adineta steineri TaxID=433720 RepID=A0A813R9S5_9BILA|nr:unnamed protein product [Adineta steineri]